MTNLQTQSAEAVVNDLGFVGTEEDHVTGLSACDFDKFGDDFVGEVLHHRSLHAFTAGRDIVDLDVGQAVP